MTTYRSIHGAIRNTISNTYKPYQSSRLILCRKLPAPESFSDLTILLKLSRPSETYFNIDRGEIRIMKNNVSSSILADRIGGVRGQVVRGTALHTGS